MKNFLKKLIIIHYSLFTIHLIFALPTVTQKLKDSSGEYVYYRDNSFKRESYIGFLYYDESTYQVRYFAPAAGNEPAKNLEILFSVNPQNPHLELTGERFITPPQPDDTDIINYIHDLLYDLTSRRAKIDDIEFTDYTKGNVEFLQAGKRINTTYEQFGGDVTMIYDNIVPIFNLKKIIDYKGSDAFVVVTTGRLASFDDKSFSAFVPPSLVKDNKQAVPIKAGKKASISYAVQLNEKQSFKQEIQADANWKKQGENMWTFDNAFIFLSGLKFPEEVAVQGKDAVAAQVIRRYVASGGDSYTDWSTLNIFVEKDKIKINASKYNPQTGHFFADIKTFGQAAANLYGCFSFTAFKENYKKNRGYYDKLIKSYSFVIQ